MSLGGRADAARLRSVIAEMEARAGSAPAGEPRPVRRVALASAFDPALGGGLASDALHEIVPAAPADGAAAMAFALALVARFLERDSSAGFVIGESFAAEEAGALYGPGLAAHGLTLRRLVFVSAPDAASAFWAMEEALKCGAPAAVVGEIWSLKGYGLVASRRLLLAARRGRTPALLVLAGAYGQADRLSTAAATRFEIAAAPSARIPAAAGRDLPGPFACRARLVKARAGGVAGAVVDRSAAAGDPGFSVSALNERASRTPLQAHDPTRAVRLEWRYEERTFDDPAISLALAAASGDGPRAASQ
jgi:protein ImuA